MDPTAKSCGALDTAKKLRTFLDALKTFCVQNRGGFQRRCDFFDDLGCADIPGLMQFLDLLGATYNKSSGAPRGFCKLVCNLMIGWADSGDRQALDGNELEAAMLSKWAACGRPRLIPEALMRPEYKAAMDYAADYLLGSDLGAKAISSGLRLSKVLTGMYAIQIYLHTRDPFVERVEEDLADVMVEDLTTLDLPEGWRDILQQESAAATPKQKPASNTSAPSLRPPSVRAALRAEKWRARTFSTRDDDVPTCRDCDKLFASEASLANHKQYRCPTPAKDRGSSRNEKSETSAVDVDPDEDPTVRKKAKSGVSEGIPAEARRSPEDDVAADVAQALKAMLAKGIKAGARLLTEEG
ncbi:hypothetical protein KFL_000460090 [Klebsormidium nitens]|uniref:Uncharacterized protein n=1 Tax=Klebsormidium nitens TaxID=105231 RepID=A0A1Y1HSD9_KLENI|nr:hypothetical protein KFL_000460090 [Klebsormidium nitens]|eukprot:GAQ80099.1 hypothetical protein KFL_000460090 [Klebsormidium nitens]